MSLHQEISTGSYRFNDIHRKVLIVHMYPLHHFPDHLEDVVVDDQLRVAEDQSGIEHAGTVNQICPGHGRAHGGQCFFMRRLRIGQFAVSLPTGRKAR
jgi:hypothetical protein